jgi:hypothetical protein
MEGLGLGLGLGLQLNTGAAPKKVINMSKVELEELKSHIDDGHGHTNEDLKVELLRVIDTLLSNRLPNTGGSRLIVNLKNYEYMLIHNKDKVESIRSALLGEFGGLLAAAQIGGRRTRGRRRIRSTKRLVRRRKNN